MWGCQVRIQARRRGLDTNSAFWWGFVFGGWAALTYWLGERLGYRPPETFRPRENGNPPIQNGELQLSSPNQCPKCGCLMAPSMEKCPRCGRKRGQVDEPMGTPDGINGLDSPPVKQRIEQNMDLSTLVGAILSCFLGSGMLLYALLGHPLYGYFGIMKIVVALASAYVGLITVLAYRSLVPLSFLLWGVGFYELFGKMQRHDWEPINWANIALFGVSVGVLLVKRSRMNKGSEGS